MSEDEERVAQVTGREAGEEEAEVRRLLAEAGARPPLPAGDLAAVTAAARVEWRRRYGAQRRPNRPSRWRWPLAAAAALAVAAGIFWGTRSSTAPAAPVPAVARIELLSGTPRLAAGAGEPAIELEPGAVGRELGAGAQVETGGAAAPAGRLALRLAGGASLRLDAGTRVRLVSAALVELERGAVYVDSGAGSGGRGGVTVSTPSGRFADIGTQFEVRFEANGGGATRLRVREGSVAVDRAGEDLLAAAGEELVVRAAGDAVRRPIARHGAEWDWVLSTAPRPAIEGAPVRSFLDWIAREGGWRLAFADPEAERRAEQVILHGSIEHLTPDAALAVVLASSGFDHRLADGTLTLFAAESR